MNLYHQRKDDIEKHIKEEYMLLKELEENLRLTQEPQQKRKLKKDIQESKARIDEYRSELDSLSSSLQQQELLYNAMPTITFDELELVTKAIINIAIKPAPPETNFDLTNPADKISKNRFTDKVMFPLTMGMAKVWEVNSFVDTYATLNSSFPEKLKAGFIQEYKRLRAAGLDGDALFDALCKFSSGNSTDIKQIAAGLAVLSYLFWKCEVFER